MSRVMESTPVYRDIATHLDTTITARSPSAGIRVDVEQPDPTGATPYILVCADPVTRPVHGFGRYPMAGIGVRLISVHDTIGQAMTLGDWARTAMRSLALPDQLDVTMQDDGYADTEGGVPQWSEGFTVYLR